MSEDAFIKEAEQLQRELLAYCHRLTGSVQDAEDLVQEAMLHGWRSYARFRGEASVRTWLYRIATNAFLSSTRRCRHLPSDLGPPATDVSLDAVLDQDTAWLEPLPDALVCADADPARLVIERDRLRLALTASFQHLPARQRSALLLREALDFSAAEIGDALGISVAAVKSLLQRARATCLPSLTTVIGQPGEWSMRPTRANGQPAAIVYRNGGLLGVAVLGLRNGGITRISLFGDPAVARRFNAPSESRH